MSHTAYPDVNDLAAFLDSAGVTVSSSLLPGAISQAIAQWETATGYTDGWPWLAEAEDSEEYFDGTRERQLFFKRGYYVEITGVETGITYNQTSGEPEGGTARVRNVGYFLTPGSPIRSLKWRGCMPHGEQSIRITGRRGHSETVPDDVWEAIRQQAAAIAYGNARNVATRGLKSLSRGSGDLSVTFADLESTVAGGWTAAFKATATNSNYRVVSL